MLDPKTGEWREPPPKYECILFNKPTENGVADGKQSNLDDYIDMTTNTEDANEDTSYMGIVYNLGDFRKRFCS